jgi:hypothetical protein
MHFPSSALFGHVYQPNGCQASVSSCDISLPNLGEYFECIPQHVTLRFSGTVILPVLILLVQATDINVDTITFSSL